MSPLAAKPVLHGRDHCPGGADPIPCLAAGGTGDFETVVVGISDLFAYWRLGEPAGPWADTAIVAGLAQADLTEHGTGPALTPDVTGALPASQDDGALEFNYDGVTIGAGRYLTGGSGTTGQKDFDLDEFTVGVWVNVKASSFTRRGVVIGTSTINVSSGDMLGWAIQVSYPSRKVRFTIGEHSGTEIYAETAAGVVAGEWNLFVGSYDGTTVRLYANGGLVASTAAPPGVTPASPDHVVQIGWGTVDYVAFDYVPGWLYGTVDEAAVWTRTLTDEEVATLYAGGTSSPGPDAVGDGTIFNRHVNAAADIDPTKLAHPGGTTQFLRADGTWAAPAGGSSDPAADTQVWMPLTTVVSSVPELVWDASNSLIPTLTPI